MLGYGGWVALVAEPRPHFLKPVAQLLFVLSKTSFELGYDISQCSLVFTSIRSQVTNWRQFRDGGREAPGCHAIFTLVSLDPPLTKLSGLTGATPEYCWRDKNIFHLPFGML